MGHGGGRRRRRRPGVVLHTDSKRVHRAQLPGPPASGSRSPSRWVGRARRWMIRSSNRGIPRWSSSSGPCISSPPGTRRAAASAWIEDYNHVRRHSALGMRQPSGFTSGRWRERTPRDRGAGHAKEAAAPSLPLLRPLNGRGRHPGLQGASHRPAGDGPAGRLGLREPLRPLGAEKAGRPEPAPTGRGHSKDTLTQP